MSRLFDVSSLFGAPVGVAYHLVSSLAIWLAPMPGGMATATAIVVFTAAVRLALLPLSYRAVRGEIARTRLLPRVAQLRQRYARQPDRLQRELSQLYRREGAGLLAGCLPMLLQLPFFSVMYRLFSSRAIQGAPNTLLTHRLLGAPLAGHLLGGAGPLSRQGIVFFGLFSLLAVVAWFSVRAARATSREAGGDGPAAGGAPSRAGRTPPRAGRTPPRAGRPGSRAGGTPPRAGRPGSRAGGASGERGALEVAGRLLPYGSVLAAAVLPLAAGLYLLTTTAWTVLERAVLRRRLAAAAHG